MNACFRYAADVPNYNVRKRFWKEVIPKLFHVDADKKVLKQRTTWLKIAPATLEDITMKFGRAQGVSVVQAYMAVKSWYTHFQMTHAHTTLSPCCRARFYLSYTCMHCNH